MTRLEKLEREIQELSPREFSQLREWVLERDWDEWDHQIESDAAEGKLDGLMREAVADHVAGKSRRL
jgi:hypothetical protein